jgi:hypothetical protein
MFHAIVLCTGGGLDFGLSLGPRPSEWCNDDHHINLGMLV